MFAFQLTSLDIISELQLKIPQTTRYIRTVINIARGDEALSDMIFNSKDVGGGGGGGGEDRFTYYMKKISENAESFRELQQLILTNKNYLLYSDDPQLDFNNANVLVI
jgi:hypothetical protein